jgi:phosphoribosylformylglycinamidine (FGAM) synthase PurS component
LVNNLDLEEELAVTTFSDPVSQEAWVDRPAVEHPDWQNWDLALEVAYKPGVTNPLGITAREALHNALGSLPEGALIQTAHQYLFQTSADLSGAEVQHLQNQLHNNLIEKASMITKAGWAEGQRFPREYPFIHDAAVGPVETIPVLGKSDQELLALSKDMLLALSLEGDEGHPTALQRGKNQGLKSRAPAPGGPHGCGAGNVSPDLV